MSLRGRHAASVAMAWVLVILPAVADEKKDKKDAGGDETQSFDSPLPLVGGATLSVAKEKQSISLALAQQGRLLFANYWQVGLAGTASETGSANAFTQGKGLEPGLKGKFGLGYSSFQAEATSSPARDAQVDRFMREAWCLDVVGVAVDLVPDRFLTAMPRASSIRECGPVIVAAQSALSAWQTSEKPPDEETARKIATALAQAKASGGGDYSREAHDEACDGIKKIDWAFRYCDASGKKLASETRQGEKFPALEARIVTIAEKKIVFNVSLNWTPAVVGIDYRPVTDGVPDLADKQTWRGFLNGGSLDASLAYRSLKTGVQIAYADKLEEDTTKPVDVCKRTTQDDLFYDQCKSAVIGKPDPFASLSLRGVIAVDPLVPSLRDSLLRPGAQLNVSWERLQAGKTRYTVSLPVYLARVDSPFDLVFGLKPTYIWNRGSAHADDFTVAVFVGARP